MIPRRVIFLSLVAAVLFGCQSITAHSLADVTPPSSTFDAQGDYLIGKGDALGVSVHGDDTLSGTYTVDENGNISLPLVGFLPVEGLTAKELQKRVESGFTPYVQTPKVGAWVADRRSFHAYFCGEVGKVGMIAFSEPVSILQGIALAGGLTPYASKRIVILRKNGKQGHTERYSVSYSNLLAGGKPYDTFKLDRGDTIIAE